MVLTITTLYLINNNNNVTFCGEVCSVLQIISDIGINMFILASFETLIFTLNPLDTDSCHYNVHLVSWSLPNTILSLMRKHFFAIFAKKSWRNVSTALHSYLCKFKYMTTQWRVTRRVRDIAHTLIKHNEVLKTSNN